MSTYTGWFTVGLLFLHVPAANPRPSGGAAEISRDHRSAPATDSAAEGGSARGELATAAAAAELGDLASARRALERLMGEGLAGNLGYDVQQWLAKCLFWQGEYTAAETAIAPLLLAKARISGEVQAAGETFLLAGQLARERFEWAEARRLLIVAEGSARRSRDLTTELLARIELALVLRDRGRERDAGAMLNELAAAARTQGSSRAEITAIDEAASLAIRRGEMATARKLLAHGLQRAGEVGMLAAESRLLLQSADVERTTTSLAQAMALSQRALELARRAGDRRAEAASQRRLGSIEKERGNFAAAAKCYRAALKIQTGIGQLVDAAESEADLGSCDRGEGAAEKALALYRRLATLRRDKGQASRAMLAQWALASQLFALGRYHEAAATAADCVAYFKRYSANYARAMASMTLSDALLRVDGVASAALPLAFAKLYFVKTRDQLHHADALFRVASHANYDGQFREAKAAYKQSLSLYEAVPSQASIAGLSYYLGTLDVAAAEYESAIDKFKHAIALHQRRGDTFVGALNGLADCRRRMGQYDDAAKEYQQALDLSRKAGDRGGQANSLAGLANVALDQRQWALGSRLNGEALALRQRDGIDELIAVAMRAMGYTRSRSGDHAGALHWFVDATSACRATAGPVCKALGIEGQGDAYLAWERYPQADAAYRASLALFEKLGLYGTSSRLLSELGDCDHARERDEEALRFYHQALQWPEVHGPPELIAQRLTGLVRILRSGHGGIPEARRLAMRALHIREALHNPGLTAIVLDELGNMEDDARNYQAALQYYRRELALDKEGKDEPGRAITLLNLGDTFTKTHAYQEAIASLREALAIYRRWHIEEGSSILSSLGNALRISGHCLESIEALTEAKRLAREPDDIADALTDLALAQQGANQFDAALESYNSALGLTTDPAQRAVIYNARARLYKQLKQFKVAAQDLESDLQESAKVKDGDPGEIAVTYNDIAELLYSTGRYEDALPFHDKALKIVQHEARDQLKEVHYLWTKAATLAELKRPGEALALIQQGLRLPGLYAGQAAALHRQEGSILKSYPELGDAQSSYRQALDLATTSGDVAMVYILCSELGDLTFARSDLAAAEKWYGLSLERTRKLGNADEEAAAEYNLGRVAERRKDVKSALEHYQRAMELRESLRSAAGWEDFRISVASRMVTSMRRAVDLLVEGEDYRRAFDLLERVRARSLLDQLAGAHLRYSADPSSGGEPNARFRQQLQDIESRLDIERGASQLAALERQRLEILNAYEATAHKGAAAAGGGESVIAALRPISFLQSRMPPGSTLLVYYIGDRTSVVFCLDRRSFSGVRLADPDKIRAAATQAILWGPAFGDQKRGQLRKLYKLLIAPVRASLHGTTLGIVPHDALQRVPFAALLDGDQYLCDRFALFELPAANMVALLRPGESRPGKVLALSQADVAGGQHLGAAAREAREIAAMLGSAPAVTNVDGTELLRLAPAVQVLHVAAHARIYTDNPWNSAILLRQPLSILQLKQLKAPHLDLVVLSACKTQGAKLSASDDAISLQRVFLVAGARSVVASLWDVDDEATRELMLAFYGHMQGGHGAAAALAQAQAELRSRRPDPLAWAGFVLSGDPGPIHLAHGRTHFAIFFFAALGSALIILLGAALRAAKRGPPRSAR